MSETTTKWTKLLTGVLKFLPEAQWVAIVVELLHQLTSAMGVTSGDSKEALQHIEGLRGELGQVTTAHAALLKQLNDQGELLARQSEKLDALSTELHSARLATASFEAALANANARLRTIIILACVLLFATVGAIALLLRR